jgi:hypothetical protein
MQIVCLKWGDKYDASYVNRLYKMVKKHFHMPFSFTCITDSPTGVSHEICIEPLPLEYDLKEWWWKLTLFENLANEPTMFIDLDVVIQNDITDWINLIEDGKLCTVKAYWKAHLHDYNPHNDHDLNSSVMLWSGDLTHIWEDFEKNNTSYMNEYRGIDSVLYNHHLDSITWIPRGNIYSRLYGIDENRHWIRANHQGSAKKVYDNLFYDETYKLCIFNGYKRIRLNSERQKVAKFFDERAFNGFEHYWS